MEPIQFAAPFAIDRAGVLTVDQGSVANSADNIYNICVCPRGSRDTTPQFGIPSITFQKLPINVAALQSALQEYEPDADLSIEQHREAVGQAGVAIYVA